jgi:uncharacterized protein YbjT (DUF2867 family)
MAGGRIAAMRALVIGGTGLISRGIVKHLLARGVEVRAFNRGKSAAPPLPADVRTVWATGTTRKPSRPWRERISTS